MKKFNRVLAMLLALVTVLAVLPISALADDWLSVDADKTTVENVTSTDITVTVDPQVLLSYMKDGDIKGLLKGISASGSLSDILTKEEILALIPEEQIIALVKAIIADIDVKELVACLDADKLLDCVDKQAIISILKDMDLKSYVKDGAIDVVMSYISDADIQNAIDHIDIDALINDYSAKLMDLALDLSAAELFEIVDLDKAVALNGIDVEAAANLTYIQNVIGYAALAAQYVNEDALKAFIEANPDRFTFEVLGEYFGSEADNAEGLLNDGIITVQELIANDIISVDAIAADYGYANLVKVDVIKAQITDALDNSLISSADVVACLNSYGAAIDAIGIKAVIGAIGGYKNAVKYVDVTGFVKSLDVKAIISAVLTFVQSGDFTKLVEIERFVRDLDVRAILSMVDYKQAVKVLYESGVAQTLLDQLDLEGYLLRIVGIYNTIATTVTEIKINGDAITVVNPSTDAVQLNPQKLLEALENMLPSLKELANIDDSGKLFSTSFAISYYESEAWDAEIVTKEITLNFALASGADLIRKTAAKLSYVLDKIGYIGLAEGKLIVDVNIPSEFASVLRVALNELGDSESALADSIKDKVLAIYTQNPDDFIAFAEGLTMEEIMAVLEAVDPALFGKAYNKVLTSRYAKVLLSFVERYTGYDFSDNLEAQNLVNTLATIPTFEVFVNKLESVTGKEISDRLPAKINGYYDNTVYDVFDKLGEVAGYDFDMQNLLKQAAASTDPFAFLYTVAVNKVENVTYIYNYVKRNAVRVADRLLASQIGQKFADLSLMSFYAGDSKFVLLNKEVSFNVKAIISNKMKAALNIAASRISAVDARKDMIAAEIDNIINMVFADVSVITTGAKVTVGVRNIYKATFIGEDNKVILSTLLPTGVQLTEMVDNYNGVANFEGWRDVATNAIINQMPAKDITVKASFETAETTPEETTPEVPEETTPEETTPEETTPDEPEVIVPDVTIDGLVYGKDYVTESTATEYKVILKAAWATELRFAMPVEVLADIAAANLNLVFASEESLHNVTLNVAMLNQLIADAAGNTVVGFNYKPEVAPYAALGLAANSGAVAYDFYFDFDNAIQSNYAFGADATVVITVPFAGVETNDFQKTFVYANGVADVEVTAAGAQSVTFVAKHFSNYTIVNKYLFTIENDKTYVAGSSINKVIATLFETNNQTINGVYFEEGAEISVTLDVDTLAGYKYVNTVFEGASLVLTAEGTYTFVMPGNAVTVKHNADAVEYYYVYYYVNGNKVGEYKYSADVAANDVVNAVLGFDLSNYPAVVGEGWSWYGSADLANKLYGEAINLFRVHEEQTQITISFAGQANVGGTYKLNELNQNVFAQLKSNIDAVQPGYVWTANGKTLTYYIENADYTALIEAALSNGNAVAFAGVLANEYYHVYAGDDVTVENTDAGIKITVPTKAGYTVKIQFYNANGELIQEIAGNEVTIGTLTSDLYVSAEYTAIPVSYKTIVITVPAGSVLNATDVTTLASAPADLVLYGVERDADGTLKLTYRYTETEGFDETKFLAEVNALITAVQYVTTWIVNGVAYNSEAEALNAQLPEGAKIVGWEQMSENVKVAIIEYAPAAGVSTWVVVCIVLVVLLILAIIVLVYVLHVTDKIQTSWLTKVCAAIVGAFFAFCMILAKATYKVLNFMGIKTEEILEDLPEEEPVADIPAVILEPEVINEEAAEEVPAEEVVEEATEEAVEEATEEAVEEATEEAVEEVPAEEVVEEATEEAVEEAPAEEAVEEAPAEEVVEETTEEAVEEVPAEEVVEEATEDAVEEATEEVVEEATEEVVEEAAEKTEEVVE